MNEKDINIENRLKELRKLHSLSQEELADKLGISRQSIIALEQGRYMPSLPLAINLCQFFNAAFEEVFDFQNEIEQEIHEAFQESPIKINIINNPQEIGSRKDGVMSELGPWRPFREAVSLRDAMDRLFEDSVITPTKNSVGMPRIDIKDKKGTIEVRAELPGIKEDDINVEIMDNVMTISGERMEDKEEKDEEAGYYYKESHTGSFSRSFTLPSEVVGDKASAEMHNGVLKISVPKVEPKKAKKIEIKKVKIN
ncbi:MAG: Hsp20 family protein [bacterium]